MNDIKTVNSIKELAESCNVISLLNEIFTRERFFPEHTKLISSGYKITEVYDILSKIRK